MKNQVLVKRYAQGLVDALEEEPEFLRVKGELEQIRDLLKEHEKLQGVMVSPFFSSAKKTMIMEEILQKLNCRDKTSRYILLLQEHGRLDLLDNILGALPELWNEKLGIITYEVSSVVPLADIQKTRLQAQLEKIEKNPVRLFYKLDAGIIGGLTLKKGHIVYDVSIQGNLLKLKQNISEG